MAATEDASAFLPDNISYKRLAEASQKCRGCPLYQAASQAVMGDGALSASIMLVGEQPGDQEDRVGEPFVGPAGKKLDELLERAGIERSEVYVTNAVKHFKFEEKGSKRLHKKPTYYEIDACRPWLSAELEVVRPEVVVALGASAARSLLAEKVAIGKSRGKALTAPSGEQVVVTYHPSAALRHPYRSERERIRYALLDDLRLAASLVRG